MSKFKRDVLLRLVKAADAVMITVPFLLCWFFYYADRVASPYYAKGNYVIAAAFFVLYIVLGRVYEAFTMSSQRISEIVYSQALAAGVSDVVMYFIILLLSKHLPNLLPGLLAFGGQLLMAAIWAQAANHWYFRTFPPQPTIVVYDDRHGMQTLIKEYGLSKKYDVQKTVSVSECLADLSMLASVETVLLSGIHSHERNMILKYCIAQGIGVFVIPRIGDVIMSGAVPRHRFHLPMLQVERYMAPPEYLFAKRALDIVLSLLALVLTSPIMLITAFAVKITDGGPVFYKQIRLTKDGRQFYIHKFRSMRVDAERDGVARLSTGVEDDRITPVGRFIRKCRIDELPQLIDILRGDLSIVGDRRIIGATKKTAQLCGLSAA